MILDVANVWGLAVALAAAGGVALRWRRGGLVVRQQLKWFLVTVPFLFASAVVVQDFPDALTLGLVLGGAASFLMAVAIGLPVLRYGLYEIDVLISRGVVYGLLSGAVAGIYLAAAAAAGGLTGAGWDLSVPVLATVVAAAVLLPVRGRLQRRVDRLFFGDRGAPYTAMARLGRQVEEATTAEPVLSSVVAVVAGSLRLPYAAVELRVGDSWVPSAAWGEPAPQVVAFPLTFQRETVGRLFVGQRAAGERLSPDDERLLASLARQVAPAAHAVALRQALDASRAALVTAREEERRGLRRDLHDGLGPTLAALVLGLQTACTLPAGSRQQEELLNTLKAETQGAVTDIRRIVYGLRPPALDELGLAGALRAEVARLGREPSGPSIALHLPGDDLDELPAAVEVAAYRIVIEALTNVLRHARAHHCQIQLRTGPDLRLEVRDDGAGLPDGWRAGVGITAMRERAAELGGELTIEPARPHGTRITACLPVSRPGLHAAELRVLACPLALAQHELLDLAGRGLRQRPELDRVRALVVREALAAERDDLLRGRRGALVERDERLGPLPPVRVRDPDDRALEHRRVGGDRLLDLDAGDVLSAGDDDVLAAVAQLDVAVGMPHGQVPGMEPAAVERLCRWRPGRRSSRS